MIGYVTIGTNDRPKAVAFYDKVLGLLGGQRAMETDRFIGWSGGGSPMLAVIDPYDGNPASCGNGTMVALSAPDTDTVDRVYAQALELGAADDGAPGVRGEGSGFYGAYFRDLDGNKICIFNFKS